MANSVFWFVAGFLAALAMGLVVQGYFVIPIILLGVVYLFRLTLALYLRLNGTYMSVWPARVDEWIVNNMKRYE